MKSNRIVPLAMLASGLTAMSVCAGQGEQAAQAGRGPHEQQVAAKQQSEFSSMRKAKSLIGAEVQSYTGDKIGKVEDLVLNRNSDAVSYVVLSSGGIAGIGSHRMAVPLKALRTDLGGETLMVNLREEDIKNAPELGDDWPSQSEDELRQAKDYLVQKSAEFKDWVTNEPRTPSEEATDAQRRAQTQVEDTMKHEQWARRASNLIGVNVRNSENRQIGELADMIVDTQKGKVAFGLIEIQDISGLDDQMLACPWRAIDIVPREKEARVTVSDATIRALAFRRDNMPDLSNRRYAESVYKQFNEEPYWTTYGYEGSDDMRHPRSRPNMPRTPDTQPRPGTQTQPGTPMQPQPGTPGGRTGY